MSAVEGSLLTDDVRSAMFALVGRGIPCALVTLVNVEGSSPRPVGSQALVAKDGTRVGHVSGDCIEDAIAAASLETLDDGHWRLIRYGKGSDYFDLQLPCGSGIDVLITPVSHGAWLEKLERFTRERKECQLRISLAGPKAEFSVGVPPKGGAWRVQQLDRRSVAAQKEFVRSYCPRHRVVAFGSGTVHRCFMQLAKNMDFELHEYTPPYDPKALSLLPLDRFTSIVVMDHEHEREIPVLKWALQSSANYVGAMGSSKTHKARVLSLLSAGVCEDSIRRVSGPAGLSIGKGTPQVIALSIIAEICMKAGEATGAGMKQQSLAA